MTLRELITHIRILTQESEYLEDDTVISAAERALMRIYSELDLRGRASVTLCAPKVISLTKEIQHSAGKADIIPLSGLAYSFTVFGSAKIIIKDGDTEDERLVNGNGVTVRGFVRHGGEIHLLGDYFFVVKNLAFFDGLFDGDAESIPVLGRKRETDLKRYVKDLSIPLGVPKNESGKEYTNAYFEGSRLVTPADFSADVYFEYKRNPPRLSEFSPDGELDLPTETAGALISLTAAYVLLCLEADGADFYESEYRAIKDGVIKKYGSHASEYTDVTGWA